MRKILLLILLSFSILVYQAKYLVNKYSHGLDNQITTLTQSIQYPPIPNPRGLNINQKYSFTFLSQHANLGTIAFLFDKSKSKDSNDYIQFRIKDKQVDSWQYQEQYSIDKFSSDQYFTFGFPPFIDSENNEYTIELEHVSAGVDEHSKIYLEEDKYYAQYSYSKNYLKQNSQIIPLFIASKLQGYLDYIPVSEIFTILISSLLPILGYLFFTNNQELKQQVIHSFELRNKSVSAKQQANISVFLLSIYTLATIIILIMTFSEHTESSEWLIYVTSSILIPIEIIAIKHFFKNISSKIHRLLAITGYALVISLLVYLFVFDRILHANYLLIMFCSTAWFLHREKNSQKSLMQSMLIQLSLVFSVLSYFYLSINNLSIFVVIGIVAFAYYLPKLYKFISGNVSRKNIFISTILIFTVFIASYYSTIKKIDYHHSAFYVGPAYEILQGKSILSDAPSQYGYLSIHFISSALSSIGITFENFQLLNQSLFIIYYLSIFLIILRVTKNNYISLVAALIAIFLQTQFSHYSFIIGPATGPLRFGFGIAILLALVYFPKKISLPLSSMFAAIALFWSVETGVYIVPAYIFSITAYSFVQKKSINRRLVILCKHLGIFIATTISLLSYIIYIEYSLYDSWPTLESYTQFARVYQDGWVSMLIPTFGNHYLVIIIMLGGVSFMVTRILSKKTTYISELTFIVVHNLAIFSYFVSRSHQNNIVNISIFMLLECIFIYYLSSQRGKLSSAYLIPASLFVSIFFYISVLNIYNPYKQHILNESVKDYVDSYGVFQEQNSLSQNNTIILSDIADTPIITTYKLKTILPLNPSLMTMIIPDYQEKYINPNLSKIRAGTNIITAGDYRETLNYLRRKFLLQEIPVRQPSLFRLYTVVDINHLYNQ